MTDWNDGAALDAEALAGVAAHGEAFREKRRKEFCRTLAARARADRRALASLIVIGSTPRAWRGSSRAGGADRHQLDAEGVAWIVAAVAVLIAIIRGACMDRRRSTPRAWRIVAGSTLRRWRGSSRPGVADRHQLDAEGVARIVARPDGDLLSIGQGLAIESASHQNAYHINRY